MSEQQDTLKEAVSLLQQVLPEWADEVENDSNTQACCELTNRDVVMIRDFLKKYREEQVKFITVGGGLASSSLFTKG